MPEPAMTRTADETRSLAAQLLSLLDLTSLGEDDTPDQIEALCACARTPFGLPAAICVYPEHVTTVRRQFKEGRLKVATVVNFPDGRSEPGRITRETRRAISAGADEILPFRALIAGKTDLTTEAVVACRAACSQGIGMKLILETGVLQHPSLIRHACEIGLGAGVDFLKTSTGKVPVNATPAAANVMIESIAAAGGRCGLKLSGGIRTVDEAAAYLDIISARMGRAWIDPQHVRFGASALLKDILAVLSPQ
jgi:deoxyribose-phosphate aldolase